MMEMHVDMGMGKDECFLVSYKNNGDVLDVIKIVNIGDKSEPRQPESTEKA